jgi:hypothetical protein
MYRRRRPSSVATEEPDARVTEVPSTPAGKRGSATLFVVGFGLLPLWVLAFLVIAVNEMYLWYVLFAVPLCAVTLGIAAFTVIAYRSASGTPGRKRRAALNRFLLLTGLVLAVALAFNWRNDEKAKELGREERLALEFVRSHPEVIARAGGDVDSIVSLTSNKIDGSHVRLEHHVIRPKPLNVIVEMTRSNPGPAFTLVCFPVLEMGMRQSNVDACLQ